LKYKKRLLFKTRLHDLLGLRIARGRTSKKVSDLDLVVMGDTPLSSSVLADLEESFRESDLPFKVDVVDWATTKETFRRIIEREYVVVQKSKD